MLLQKYRMAIYIIHIYSGIACVRVLNGEFYTCKLYKLINLCWFTGCFRNFTKQPVDQHRLINLYNLHEWQSISNQQF